MNYKRDLNRGWTRLFNKNRKLKKDFDEQLRSLMIETKADWQRAKEIENYLNDYDQEVIVQRQIAESKHFYLYKEAKERNLGSN